MKKLIWKQSLQFSSNENSCLNCCTSLNFFRPYFHSYSSSVHNCKDRFHIHFFNCSSHIWISYIYSHLFTTSQVYLEPTLGPAPSWLVNSVGRVLHWYCRGHGFKFRTGLNFFWLYFHYFLSSVHNCEDRSNICLFMRICGKIKITASTW